MRPTELVGIFALLSAPFVGSFLGTVVERLPEGRPLVFTRSSCPHCGQRLGVRELVPILSWLIQRGACRRCGASLGLFYPVIELAALVVVLSVAVAMKDAPLSIWIASLGFGWTLLALAWIDARHYFLPDLLTLPLIPLGLLVSWRVNPDSLGEHVIGAAVGYVSFAAIAFLYRRVRGREGIGGGDAKLMAAAGAWVSWSGLPSVILVASLSGLILALVQAVRGDRLTGEKKLAFGPHLSLGLWIVWLLGPLTLG